MDVATVIQILDSSLRLATPLLLVLSNIVMTFAWYGHLKAPRWPIWVAILVSWGIAFFEYCLAVPANRLGVFLRRM